MLFGLRACSCEGGTDSLQAVRTPFLDGWVGRTRQHLVIVFVYYFTQLQQKFLPSERRNSLTRIILFFLKKKIYIYIYPVLEIRLYTAYRCPQLPTPPPPNLTFCVLESGRGWSAERLRLILFVFNFSFQIKNPPPKRNFSSGNKWRENAWLAGARAVGLGMSHGL